MKFEGGQSTASNIFNWIADHYGYANIIIGIFIAIWLKIFFRKHQYNLFEILILLCFVMGVTMLIFALFGLFQGLTNLNLMSIGGMVGVVYSSWAIGHFFGKDKVFNYAKALFAYLLGMITFVFLAVYVGFFIDWLIKH